MYTTWNPRCRACNVFVDAKEQHTSVHSPPNVKEAHFGFYDRKQLPVTTDLQRWLDNEEQLDAIMQGTIEMKDTRMCIYCTTALGRRFQCAFENNANERSLLLSLPVTAHSKENKENELHTAEQKRKEAEQNWVRACQLLRALQHHLGVLKTKKSVLTK